MISIYNDITNIKYHKRILKMKGKTASHRTKGILVRLDVALWSFLKKLSVDEETSINEIFVSFAKKLKKNKENKLTDNDNMIT